MERNTVTQFHELQIGDRFYMQNDKRKEVRARVSLPVKMVSSKQNTCWSINAGVYDNHRGLIEKLPFSFFKIHRPDALCVFLRHTELSTAKLPNE